MKPASRRPILSARGNIIGVIGIMTVGLLGIAIAGGQTAPAQKPEVSEQAFKNVQVLRGIPVNEFMETMGFFAASLGENCTFCHVAESGGDWARYADDQPQKLTARKMIVMMNLINQTYFGGNRELTCYSCHHGDERPQVTPNLAVQYSAPVPIEPDTLQDADAGSASVDKIFARYLQALGGAQQLAKITGFAAKGTYQGFGEPDKFPVEVFAQAPDQRAAIVHEPAGDLTTTYDGSAGWFAAPTNDRPIPVVPLAGGDLEGARLDAQLSFPGQIKQTLKDWSVIFPSTIGSVGVDVVQASSDGRTPVNFYFAKSTGLLVRMVRYNDSPVGFNPTQIDYADYRLISTIKMPFKWTVTWTDGRSVTQLATVQLNSRIDAAKFAKPLPPLAPSKSAKP
jgi:photosynthetic reaction center cytochrome c subunit